MALPASVAPKNCQKGIRKWPQQMPHRSNSAFGHAASRKMPQNPCLRSAHAQRLRHRESPVHTYLNKHVTHRSCISGAQVSLSTSLT